MISFYRIAFVVAVIVGFFSLLLLSTSGFPIDRRLSAQPDNWTFTFNTPDKKLLGMDEPSAKNSLLIYLHKTRAGTPEFRTTVFLVCLTAAVFSYIGWRRELHIARAHKESAA